MLVGLIGWRGMVGSVLIKRMVAEGDFKDIEVKFFSTSNSGGLVSLPVSFNGRNILYDAYSLDELKDCDVILTCQGSSFTNKIFKPLRNMGWSGFWIDASRELRMENDSVIVLDPVNHSEILSAIKDGKKNFCGGNCTVSCLLMAINGLVKNNLVEWISSTTYQAASGGGSNHIRELLRQMGLLHGAVKEKLEVDKSDILEIDKLVLNSLKTLSDGEKEFFKVPLAGSLISWIDQDLGEGSSLEEWKGNAELNKILGLVHKDAIPVDYTCVRVGTIRCHSQSLLIKLKKEIPVDELGRILKEGNSWVEVIKNTKEDSERYLSPVHVSGTLKILIGRIRKMRADKKLIGAFTVGDQLLWGAAEPLRRMLRILVNETNGGEG